MKLDYEFDTLAEYLSGINIVTNQHAELLNDHYELIVEKVREEDLNQALKKAGEAALSRINEIQHLEPIAMME